MIFDPEKPYNELPLLPPKSDLETKKILRQALTSGRALAELKGLGETIPSQALLVDSLILQEAKASSEIENVITTNDALFQAYTASTSKIDPATKEVLRYREALWEGFNLLQKRPVLTTNLFIKIVQILKQNDAGIRNAPGTKISSTKTGKTIFTPPEGVGVIRDKLKNLEDYIHAEDETDPLIKLAAIHYQFESIHPFFDGNGRTGRIINILYLTQQNLLSLPVLYLSRYIIENKTDYYSLLRNVTEKGDWEFWVLFMLRAVEETSIFSRDRILAIRNLLLETMELAKEKLPARVYSKELLEMIFRQPYTKGQFLVDAGLAKRQTAAEYLKMLEDVGILKLHKIGKENIYLNVRLFQLLTS